MSGFLAFLKRVFFGVEEREEDLFRSSYYRSVERNSGRILHRSMKCTYPPIYSDDLPASSSAFTQCSPKLLSPCSIPAPPWPKPPASSSDQSQSPRLPATFLSRPTLFPPVPSTTSSKPSPQATTLSIKPSPLPPSTTSLKPSPQATTLSIKSSPLPPSTTSSKPSPQATTLPIKSSPLPPSTSSSKSSPSPQATTLSIKSSPLPPSTSSSKSSHKDPNPVFHPSPSPKPLPSFLKPTTSSSKPSPVSRGPSSSSSKQLPSFKPTLSLASPNLIDGQTKVSYLWVQKGVSPIYAVPNNMQDLIKPSPQATTLPIKSSPLPPSTSSSKSSPSPPSTSSSKSSPSPQPTTLSIKSSPSPPSTSSSKSSPSPQPTTLPIKSSPSPPSTSSSKSSPSPQPTTLSIKSSPLPPSTSSSKISPSLPPPSTTSSKSSHKYPNPVLHPSPSPEPLPSFLKPTTSSSKSSSSRGSSSSSSKQLPSFKPTLSLASPNLIDGQTKVIYLWVQKGVSPIYAVPRNMEDLIKRDIVPQVLNEPLSPSTYKDYFAALLYAEDFYIEKWRKFKLENITLKLQDAAIIKKYGRNEYSSESHEMDDKTFVEFEIDSCRERRPFLLSRDFALARPSGQKTEPYQGVIYRVVSSTIVLVEFGEDFYLQHHSTRKYDVSFSFNRVCLKRAHQATEAASDPSFKNFLFPGFAHRKSIPTSTPLHFFNHNLDVYQRSAVQEILSFQGPAPYVVEGPLCSQKYSEEQSRTGYVAQKAGLSGTGLVVQEAVLQIYQSSSKHRILICAPINRTCDALMQSLKNDIAESHMFRANAAFREIDGVPIDILTSCVYERDCFACPSIQELRKFRVILSTFVSSFRLHNEGIVAGHFSHIFLVDASSAIEPEAMVALANLAGENTAVIVTGAPGNRSGWVRSNIARENGLRRSYFERIRDSQPYSSLHPKFIKQLVDPESKSFDSYSYAHSSLSYD